MLPAALRLGVVGVTVSDNRRDFSHTPSATRITRTPRPVPPQNASAPPPPPLAIDGNATHLGYDHDLVFTEALDPTWTFEYVQPAVLEHAMPPAAIPGAGASSVLERDARDVRRADSVPATAGSLASRSGAVGDASWGGGRRAPRSPHRVGRRLDRVRRFPVGSLSRGSPPRLRRRVGLGARGPTHGADDARAVRIYPAAADVRVAAAARARRRRRRVRVVGMDLRVHDGSLVCVFATGPRVGGDVSGLAPAVPAAVAVSTAVAACECPGDLPEGVAALSVGAAGSTPTPGAARRRPLRRRSPLRRPRLPNRRIRGGRRRAHPSRRPSATGVRHRRPRRARRDVRARRRSTGRGDRVDGDCHPGSRRGIRRRRDGSIASDYASILDGAFAYREPFAVSSASPSAVAAAGARG